MVKKSKLTKEERLEFKKSLGFSPKDKPVLSIAELSKAIANFRKEK